MPTKRSHIKEDLDDLELHGKQLENTLDGLSRINRWFGNSKHTLNAVQDLFQKHEIKTIVDIGCGGGDNLISIAKWCTSQNTKIKLIGIDGNQNSLNYAKSRSDFDIDFIQADILSPDFELPECDLLMSSHFIYHFKDDELTIFLKKAKTNVHKAILFSELERNQFAYYLFWIFGFFFGKMVRSDGLKAIQRSFTKQELKSLLRASGFTNYAVRTDSFFVY